MEIYKKFKFDAAHRLPRVPEGHKCANLHGHTFVVSIHLRGKVDPEFGWVADYSDIKEAVQPLIERLDHSVLNNISGLENPTSENICFWMWNNLKPCLANLAKIEVKESADNGAIYCGDSGLPARD